MVWGIAQLELAHDGTIGFYHPAGGRIRLIPLSASGTRSIFHHFSAPGPFVAGLSQLRHRQAYHVEKSLGDGSFGTVMSARRIEGGLRCKDWEDEASAPGPCVAYWLWPTHADFKRFVDRDALNILESEVWMRLMSNDCCLLLCR